MQINRPVTLFVALAILSACSAERVVPSRPAPGTAQTPAPRPAPAPPPAAAPAARPVAGSDWRDAALTAGTWQYAREGSATVASYTSPQGSRLLALTCHRERGAVLLSRAGSASAAVPMSVITSYGARPFSLNPQGVGKPLELSLPARDPALDEMAFSRGRIAVEVSGLPTLYLPTHAEIGRVVEDCR